MAESDRDDQRDESEVEIKVTDRRQFTIDGELRKEVPEEVPEEEPSGEVSGEVSGVQAAPPSPPEGPPRGTYFSLRNATAPSPPSPALTRMDTSSMNFMGVDSPGSSAKFRGPQQEQQGHVRCH